VIRAWTDVCPQQTFSGLTLDQFKEVVKASLVARDELAELESRVTATIARRDAADIVSLEAVRRVVHSVKGDPTQGEDGQLYAAMGYTRRSRRGSGLTRRRVKNKEVEVTKTDGS
jgi:hypothetical protein